MSANISTDRRHASRTVHVAASAQWMLFCDNCPKFSCQAVIEKCELRNHKTRCVRKIRLGIAHTRLWSRLHSPQGHILLDPQLVSRGRTAMEKSDLCRSPVLPIVQMCGERTDGPRFGLWCYTLHQPHGPRRRRTLHCRWWTAEVSLNQGESRSKRQPGSGSAPAVAQQKVRPLLSLGTNSGLFVDSARPGENCGRRTTP